MRLSLKHAIVNALICFSILFLAVSSRAEENAIQALQYYFDLLSSENYESAAMLWSPAAQERSSRFRINYTDIPIRVDATSPVVRNLPTMRYHITPAAKQAVSLEDNGRVMQMEYSSIVSDQLVRWPYYAERQGEYYQFIYPQDFYTAAWPIVESKYFRIHAHPDKQVYLNPAALEEADRFVERLCDSLKIDKAVRATMAGSRIEYFFCDSDSTVAVITGQRTKGMLDLASNDIISADFPHFHEVAHLLINISLKEIPLQTLPLLREGFAVREGGRWGKRATALLDLGVYLYKEKLVELDSILTAEAFESSAGADIAYPVAGLFVSYVIEKATLPGFWKLYRELSFTDLTLDTLGHLAIRRKLVAATGVADWNAMLEDFSAYLDRVSDAVAVARAGNADGTKEVANGGNFKVSQSKEWVCFEFKGDTGAVHGNMLFQKDARLAGGRSHLFEEQYGLGQTFEGYRYGVRFDQNEAGLYDYATNELVAKYIWGINPSADYFDETNRVIRIRFRAELLKNVFARKPAMQLLAM
ncbi:MAG: hypothetical protein NDJ18_00390 [candidate division Zixibacteria bacterium]|nr:hypothetical protein [candidate division Zixibacteria bacterium]